MESFIKNLAVIRYTVKFNILTSLGTLSTSFPFFASRIHQHNVHCLESNLDFHVGDRKGLFTTDRLYGGNAYD